MRKMKVGSSLLVVAQVCCFLVFRVDSAVAFGQNAPSVKAAQLPMPSNPNELMQLATNVNDFYGIDVQPWHLKATFKRLDDQGNPKEEGTIEEFWAGQYKDKSIYTSAGFTQTTYSTEAGTMRSGSTDLPPDDVVQLRHEFVEPIPGPSDLQRLTFEAQSHDTTGGKLTCLTSKASTSANAALVQPPPEYCFAASAPALRISILSTGKTQVIRNKLVSFQGKYIPEDLQFVRAGKIVSTAHLDSIELLKTATGADFIPPPDAKPVQQIIKISAGVAQGLLVKKVTARYPPDAMHWRIQGTVVMQIIIGTDGRVSNPRIVSGPKELQQASLEAVQQSIYKPYMLNGQPVVVDATVNVVYSLSN
jgi:TonB family protein